jgi:DNA polymerase elongation subunit (family B)
MGGIEKTHWHISDDEALSELKALIYEDKTPFDLTPDKVVTENEIFTLSETYKPFHTELHYFDDLIYGKDKTLDIVAVEVVDNEIIIFDRYGNTEVRPARFWLLCDKMLDSRCRRLEGNTHYKYIRFFSTYPEFAKYMQLWKKDNVYGIWNAREQVMLIEGITLYKGMKPSDLGVLAFDIESEGLSHHKKSQVYLITNSYEKNGIRVKKHFRVDEYNNDAGKMIDDWCKWVRVIDPDIINFWNGYGYDLPYLEHVAKLNNTSLALGRDGSNVEFKRNVSQKRVDGNTSWDYHKAHIYGRQIVDGLFVALNYGVGKGYPSWGLKPIAEAEGFISESRQFYDASKIKDNWGIPEEREKIIQYGIDDSEDTINLFYRMITSYFYTCQSLPIPFEEMLQGATGKWVNSVLVRGYLQNNESVPRASDGSRVAGGMSYGVPGIYSNVLKYDAASYYPSTILKFNIYNAKKDPKNLFVKTVKYFTEARLKNKKLFKETKDSYYDDLQAAQKIFINSSYGVLATNGLNFNSFEHAAQITRNCRAGLQKAIIWATGKDINQWWEKYEEEQDAPNFEEIDEKTNVSFSQMPIHDFKLVNLDTDSLSFAKSDESEFTPVEMEQIEKELNDIMYCNWEDDGEFSRVIVSKAKNYVLLPKGSEKYKKKGSSLTDSKKEPALTEMLDQLIDSLVFNKGLEKDIYNRYIEEAKNIKDIKRWAVKKSITKKLLEGTRKNETKVTDALNLENVREGDKVWLFNKVEGEVQDVKKGEPVVYKKTGLPKMIPNKVLKLIEEFDGNYDVEHYIGRVDATLDILDAVLDIKQIKS